MLELIPASARTRLRLNPVSRTLRVSLDFLRPARDFDTAISSTFFTSTAKIAHWHRLQHGRDLMRLSHVLPSPCLKPSSTRLFSTFNGPQRASKQARNSPFVQPLKDQHGCCKANGVTRSASTSSLPAATTVRPVGRPRKQPLSATPTDAPPKRRGRPPKVAITPTAIPATRRKKLIVQASSVVATPGVSDVIVKRRGRPRKASTTTPDETAVRPQKLSRKSARAKKLPARLVDKSPNHWDLHSFLAYHKQKKTSTTSTVYRGTLYEYTVKKVLEVLGFTLYRAGKSDDRGIDLLGYWTLEKGAEPRVIIQCKASKAKPAHVRELSGTFNNAPAGWESDRVMGLLAATSPATEKTQDEIKRCRNPMAYLYITTEGKVMHFYWNRAAEELWLTGMSVSPKRRTVRHEVVQEGINLNFDDKLWKSSC